MGRYETKPAVADAVEYTERYGLGSLQGFAGAAAISICEGGAVQVRTATGEWVTLHDRWWVVKWPDNGITVASEDAFKRIFET